MKILAVDFGDARTGLACCDIGEMMASPIGVIHDKNFQRVVEKVAVVAREQDAGQIVVGHPINMNGTLGPRAQLCESFAEQLREQVELPVILWDERSTTVSAIGILNVTDVRGKKRKAVVDAVAATIILENYLSYRKHQGESPQ